MGNHYAQVALVEFGITGKNGLVLKLIKELIMSREDLEELREGLKGKSNKIYSVLKAMQKRSYIK